ncbi:hypothetical protein AAHU27_07185 [Klebsiella variicola subsp. variicola]|uniref:hypothetical protein n=1 Tax=Klebsiella variicola TaxID=244366 RepID=UPI0035A1118D
MKNEVEQIAQQNDMSIEFVTWFFNEKKSACGEHWFLMLGAMWEGWKSRSIEMDKLAAENVTMLRLLTDISENHVEYFSEGEDGMFAGVPLDYVSEINMYVSRDVNAENPFPAIDAYLAGIKVDGVESGIKTIMTMLNHQAPGVSDAINVLRVHSSELREGADK